MRSELSITRSNPRKGGICRVSRFWGMFDDVRRITQLRRITVHGQKHRGSPTSENLHLLIQFARPLDRSDASVGEEVCQIE
ncbi:MAG: hypothetical protein MI923_13615 [Phycisphaerales bacterium]|nr:hypothetical protein [Phycisphaerales bacterium]